MAFNNQFVVTQERLVTDPKIQRLSDAIAETIGAFMALTQTSPATTAVVQEYVNEEPAPRPTATGSARTAARKPATSETATTAVDDGAASRSSPNDTETQSDAGKSEAVETEDEPATMERAKALSVKLAQAHGREALVGLLADFSVGKCGELTDDQVAPYITEALARIAT